MKIRLLLMLLVLVNLFISCDCTDPVPLVNGCTELSSLNYDSDADTNDGSCRYSKITFYAKFPNFSGIPINRIDVSVDGESIGSISSYYPNAPGNCSANGTVSYQFTNSNQIDWNTTIYLANGAVITSSGTKSPNRFSECIKINVTN